MTRTAATVIVLLAACFCTLALASKKAPLAFSQAYYSVSESTPVLQVQVVRTDASDDSYPIVAYLDAIEGTAVEEFDFSATKDVKFVIEANKNSAQLSLNVYDNFWRDGNRNLQLIARNNEATWSVDATVEITDDETATSFASADNEVGFILGGRQRRAADDEIGFEQPTLFDPSTFSATESLTEAFTATQASPSPSPAVVVVVSPPIGSSQPTPSSSASPPTPSTNGVAPTIAHATPSPVASTPAPTMHVPSTPAPSTPDPTTPAPTTPAPTSSNAPTTHVTPSPSTTSPAPTTNNALAAIQPSGVYQFPINTYGLTLTMPVIGLWTSGSLQCQFIIGGTVYNTAGQLNQPAMTATCNVPVVQTASTGTLQISQNNGASFATGVANVQYLAVVNMATRFTNSGSQIQAVFNQSIGTSGTTIPCSQIIATGSLSSLGAAATCSVTASTLLTINLSPDATIAPGSSVSFVGPNAGITNVQAPASYPVPVAVLRAPVNFPACMPLTVDSSGSYNHGGRPLTYKWNVLPPTIPVTNFLATIQTSTLQALQIPVGVLAAGTTYTFALQVTNWLGKSSSFAQTTVTITDSATPMITIDSPATIRRSQMLNLQAVTSFPTCGTPEELNFQWSVPTGITALGVSASALSIDPFSLTVGGLYAFTVASQGVSSGLQTSSTAIVSITAGPLSIAPIGGVQQSVNVGDAISVGINVADPEMIGTRTAQVSVLCTVVSSGAPCTFALPSMSSLSLPSDGSAASFTAPVAANTFVANGMYNFTFTIRDSYVNSTASSSTLSVVISALSTTPAQADVQLSGDTVVAPGGSLRLVATVNAASASQDLVYTWSTVGGAEPSSTLGTYPLSTLPSGFNTYSPANGPTLVVNGSQLQPLQVYYFRVDVQQGSSSVGFAVWRVAVSSAPISGTFSVAPSNSTSQAATSLFTLLAQSWNADPSQQPLSYSFSAVYDDLPRSWMLANSYMSSQQSVLPMFAGKTASGSITVVMNVTQQDGTQTSTSMVVSVGSCAPSSSSDATNLVNNFYSMSSSLQLGSNWNQLIAAITSTVSCLEAPASMADPTTVGNFVQNVTNTFTTGAQASNPANGVAFTCGVDSIMALGTNSLTTGSLTNVFSAIAQFGSASAQATSADLVSLYSGCMVRVENAAVASLSSSSSSRKRGTFNSMQVAGNIETAYEALATMYFNAHYCNDPSMQIGSSTSSGLTFTAMRSSFSGSSSVSLAGSNNAITLGSNTLANANVDCMCLSSLQLPSSVYASSSTSWAIPSGSTVNVATSVNSVNLRGCATTASTQDIVNAPLISQLTSSPLSLSFGWTENYSSASSGNLSCAFFNTATGMWDQTGVTMVSSSSSGISCQTTHLTDFAVISVTSTSANPTTSSTGSGSGSSSNFPWWIILLIILAILLCCCCLALCLFFLIRRRRRQNRRGDSEAQGQPQMVESVVSAPMAVSQSDSLSNANSMLPLMKPSSGSDTLMTNRPPAYEQPPTYNTHLENGSQDVSTAVAASNTFDQVAIMQSRHGSAESVQSPPAHAGPATAATETPVSSEEPVSALSNTDYKVPLKDDSGYNDEAGVQSSQSDEGNETALESDQSGSAMKLNDQPSKPWKGKAPAVNEDNRLQTTA